MLPSKSGIYQIRHLDTDNVYIGSAVNIRRRIYRHITDLRKQKHHCAHLQRAFNKYGESAFSFEVLGLVDSPSDLIAAEQSALDAIPEARRYNIALTAGNCLGVVKSDATKLKHSRALMGVQKSDEHKAKIAAAAKGKTISEDQRQRLRDALIGRSRPQEVIAKIRAANLGKALSAQTREKISKAVNERSEETIAKIALASRNRSAESRLKMSLAKKGKPLSEDHKRKIRESMLAKALAR